MNKIDLNKHEEWGLELRKVLMLFMILLVSWPFVQGMVQRLDVTAGYVDPSILVLVVLSLLCFLGMIGLSWWLVKRFWMALGLPSLGGMVLQFNELLLWQQLGFYFASFALLLLAGVGCLAAIC